MFGRTDKNYPFFGQMHTAEVKALISFIHKGKTLFLDTITKISLARGGSLFMFMILKIL
jgi:hypothetical protein